MMQAGLNKAHVLSLAHALALSLLSLFKIK